MQESWGSSASLALSRTCPEVIIIQQLNKDPNKSAYVLFELPWFQAISTAAVASKHGSVEKVLSVVGLIVERHDLAARRPRLHHLQVGRVLPLGPRVDPADLLAVVLRKLGALLSILQDLIRL